MSKERDFSETSPSIRGDVGVGGAIHPIVPMLGRRWVALVLRDVAANNRRSFSTLLRSHPEMSPRALSFCLRDLQEHGLIVRTVPFGTGRRGLYRLTDRGRVALPIVTAIVQYGTMFPSEGVSSRDGNTGIGMLRIEEQYSVRAPVGAVLGILSNSARMAEWIVTEPMAGIRASQSALEMREPDLLDRGFLSVSEQNRTISWSRIERQGGETIETRVSIRLTPHGRRTQIRLEHAGFPRSMKWVRVYGKIAAGWARSLMNLKSILEDGTDLRYRAN
ncbi:MAG: winged helix-turn-helix transcriptional regulator [Thermoplasmata archaeon]